MYMYLVLVSDIAIWIALSVTECKEAATIHYQKVYIMLLLLAKAVLESLPVEYYNTI